MGGVGFVEVDCFVAVGVEVAGLPGQHADPTTLPTVAAHLAIRGAPLDDAAAVTVAHSVAVDDCLRPAVDVDASHRVVDEVAVDVRSLGLFEVDAPPPGRRVVSPHDGADGVGRPDRTQVVSELARIDLVPASADQMDPDVPTHPAEFATRHGDPFGAVGDHPDGARCTDDHVIGYEKIEDPDEETGKFIEKGWRTFYLYSRAEVTGEYITDAARAVNTQSGMPEVYVSITFSPAGADRFEEVTGANVQRRFAIILDDVINSAPVIKSKIGGGRASITMGSGDPDTQLKNAEKLEMVLRSGALPAPITPSNESLIGPTLGQDAIAKGGLGAVAGGVLVLAFMLFYYRKAGIVADGAVLFNLLIQLAILASFSGTLTLPGIAGLALTIGMAVDANVLINERIREELRAGRSIRAAVEAGYDKAFTAIVDGHVTIFISGLILAQYGTGPVKGFAVTLIIGIIASLFTGVFCTRLVFDYWVRGSKAKRLSVGAEF